MNISNATPANYFNPLSAPFKPVLSGNPAATLAKPAATEAKSAATVPKPAAPAPKPAATPASTTTLSPAQSLLEEAEETPTQTRMEAMDGDQQAILKLAEGQFGAPHTTKAPGGQVDLFA